MLLSGCQESKEIPSTLATNKAATSIIECEIHHCPTVSILNASKEIHPVLQSEDLV